MKFKSSKKSPFRWKKLSCPTREIAELIVAATFAEQEQLQEKVKAAMEGCYAKKTEMFSLCKFRGYDFILSCDPKEGPALLRSEDMVRIINDARDEIVVRRVKI
jgi:hypothetical protein